MLACYMSTSSAVRTCRVGYSTAPFYTSVSTSACIAPQASAAEPMVMGVEAASTPGAFYLPPRLPLSRRADTPSLATPSPFCPPCPTLRIPVRRRLLPSGIGVLPAASRASYPSSGNGFSPAPRTSPSKPSAAAASFSKAPASTFHRSRLPLCCCSTTAV